MLEPPDAADLLATARAAVLEKLLPALPAALHYEARMVANALAIAARAGAADTRAAEGALAALLPGAAAPLASLAAGIRAGHYAPGTPGQTAARETLEALTRARCAVSAPRALE
jgi:hypothetical protein